VALEDLTFDERRLLANLRAYAQFRQGFYTQVAIGELGVTGPQRGFTSTVLQSFPGQGNVGGFLGLLQQAQIVRNSEDTLRLQLRTLDRLNALYDNELVDLIQVDLFAQDVERQRSTLLISKNLYELSLDRYKAGTLGLPPDLPIELDERLIRQFQFIPREATGVQEQLLALQRRIGELPDVPEVPVVAQAIDECLQYVEPVNQLFDNAGEDLARLDAIVPIREKSMDETEIKNFHRELDRLRRLFMDLRSGEQGFDASIAKLQSLQEGLSEDTRRATTRGLTSWIGGYLQIVERLVLIPAQARLEQIVVEPIDLRSEDAFRVGLANRLDFKNGRAALVDQWRQIQVNADALQSVLNVTANGDIRTARNNAASFRAPTGTVRLGLEFDAPFTRLLERNSYRESLVNYQRSRRNYIQSRDSLNLGVRALLRNLKQLRENVEIQRRAVAIAMRRVDQTQLQLNPPRQPVQPGQRAPINPTLARDLLSAQLSFLSSQNSLLSAWLSYYATRMRLYRELGVMRLDPEGRWIESPLEDIEEFGPAESPDAEELPRPIPTSWIEVAEYLQPTSLAETGTVQPIGYVAAPGFSQMQRLPPTSVPPDTNGYSR